MKKVIIVMLIIIFIICFIIFLLFKENLFAPQTNNNAEAIQLSKTTNSLNEQSIEKEVSSYSTEIKDDSDGRLTNIQITCSLINDTILHPGEIFSFNEIVGQPSSSRGYQEATVIIDGEHETGIGGGNCQVSSTLYNAVLDLPFITIIERNEHGLPVAYVPKGQDAAVSFGSLDLRFRNDSTKDIRIEMISDDENIIAKIYQK